MDQQRPLPCFKDSSHADGQTLWSSGYTESRPDSKLSNEPTGAYTVRGRLSKAKKKKKPFRISCVACYQRKKKCLGGKPCDNCKARGEICERRQLEVSLSSVSIRRQSDRVNKSTHNQPDVETNTFQDQSPTTGIQVQQPSEYAPDMVTHNMEVECRGSSTGNQGIDQSPSNILSIRARQSPEIQSNGSPWQTVTENGPSELGGQGSGEAPQQGEDMAASGLSQLTPTPYAKDRQPVVYASIGMPNENLVAPDTIGSSATSFIPVYETLSKDVIGSSNRQDFDEDSSFMPLREPWTLPGFLTLDQDLIYGQQNVDPTVGPSTALRHSASMWEPQPFGETMVLSEKACDTFQGHGFRTNPALSHGMQNEGQYNYPISIEPAETYPHYEEYSDEKHHNIERWLFGTEQDDSRP